MELNQQLDVISTLSSLFCQMDQVVSIRLFMLLMLKSPRDLYWTSVTNLHTLACSDHEATGRCVELNLIM